MTNKGAGEMARKQYTTEQIIVTLRKVELLCGQENTILEASWQCGYQNRRIIGGARNTAT